MIEYVDNYIVEKISSARNSRERALAITKLQEAQMWLERAELIESKEAE